MNNIDGKFEYEPAEKPKYQDLSAIQLEETTETETDDLITVFADADTPKTDVEKKVRTELVLQNWWLQDYWKNKGVPKEQISFQTSAGNLEVFNFGDSLEQRHIDELKHIVEILIQTNNGELLQKIRYILINDQQELNPYTNEEMSGYGPVHEKAIKLFPRGLRFTSHRVPTASNFTGTIIHELSHVIATNLENEWAKEFGWHMLANPKDLSGEARQYFETENPQNCVTDYATLSPSEDICESMVAYVTHYEKLDPLKRKFIESWLPMKNPEMGAVSSVRKTNNNIELPKVQEPVRYERKQMQVRMKRRENQANSV